MHNIQHKGLRYTLAVAGLVASTVFLVASMIANWRYGYSLARTPVDGYVYGSAGAAGDLLMAASPFFFFAALAARSYLQALASALIWVATTAFAAQAAISQASVNRLDSVSARTVVATSYQDIRTELAEARKSRGFIPSDRLRPEATVLAELEKHKVNRLWSLTNECTQPAGRVAREYCSTYQALNSDLGYAMQASKLDARIAALTEKSDKTSENNAAVESEADPGARTIAIMSGYNVRSVQGASIFLVAFVILLCCGLGPYASASMLEIGQRRSKIITLDPQPPAPEAPSAEPLKLKLDAKAAKLALPKPISATRPEPAPEWRAMLDLIDFPKKKMLGARRPRDKREVLGLRFLTWLCAFGHTGEFTADQLDKLYEDFAAADNREEWATRIVKAELRDAKKWVQVKDSRSPTMWIIASPPVARLKDLLAKRKVVIPAAPEAASPDPKQEAGQGSIVPFVSPPSPASGGGAPPAPANENKAIPIKGWAELQRLLPDWERGLRALVRQDKAAWQQKMWTPHRKQLNRMSRVRAA